jgi:broad specificity phosphatase PhoE
VAIAACQIRQVDECSKHGRVGQTLQKARFNAMTISYFPTLYLVRHATPDWSRTDIPYHIPPGPPLTEKGEREAELLGDFLRDMGACQMLHSPLERCARTAQIAGAAAGVPVRLEERLAEILPEEKAPDILARVWPVWVQAGQTCFEAGPVVLVTHGGPIGILLAELGLAPKQLAHYQARFDRRNPVPPAGAWRAIRPTPDGPWSLDLAFTPEAQPVKAWYI